ncbi:MAG: glutamate ligase domain-containing protein, partial [Rudaea sp.]
ARGDDRLAPVVVDGAHIGDSANRLEASLRAEFGPRHIWLVIGVYGDKDLDAIVQPFKSSVVHTWAVRTRQPRALPAETVASRLNALGIPASPAAGMSDALAHARRSAAPGALVLVTGSFSAVAEARETLGLVPDSERDPLI